MPLDLKLRIKCVLLMAKFNSICVVKRKLNAEYGKNSPSESAIRKTFHRFCETGSVENRERSGRPRVITENEVQKMSEVIESDPQCSVRSVANACSISRTTTHRIMTGELSLKPFKVHFTQELHEEDFQDRVEMCKTLVPMLENVDIQENIFFSDEATFYLKGLVNKHNVRYWSESNPHVTFETARKSEKVNVWCALSKNKIIGPYFFEDETVNGQNYLSMLQEYFMFEVRKMHKVRSLVFQQDGAPAHFSTDVRRYLDAHFRNRWIGRGGSIRWAPRSPDLTPLDFYLWGHLKNKIYKSEIKNIDDLKTRITEEIKSVSTETLNSVFLNIVKRMNLCIAVNGSHFEQLL
jgi:DDE superfamily endonuclease/Helix-turn-helix domain (DUF4817)